MNKKLQMYIANLALKHLPFGSCWTSSAKNLSDELTKRGIVLPKKIFYEYKMPMNMSAQDFFQHFTMDYFYTNFFGKFANVILTDKKLNLSEKQEIIKNVLSHRHQSKQDIQNYESEIRKLNPELTHIKTNSPRGILYGAMFGFAPDELEYFTNTSGRDFDYEHKITEQLKNQFGIHLTYVLAPKTAKILIATLQENMQNKDKAK